MTPTEEQLRIPYAIAARYATPETDRYEELVAIGNLALVKACASYDPEKGRSLASWMFVCVERHLQKETLGTRHARRWSRLGSIEHIAEPGDCPRDRIADAEHVSMILARLAPLDRAIYRLRHSDGLTLKQISDRVGISPDTVMYRLRAVQEHLSRSLPRLSNRGGVGNLRPIPGIKNKYHKRKLRRAAARHRKEVAIENRALGKIPAHRCNWYLIDDAVREITGPALSLPRLITPLNLSLSKLDRNAKRVVAATTALVAPLGLRIARGPEARQLAESGYIAKGPPP